MADQSGGGDTDGSEETDALYGLDPIDFVAGRNVLVRRLRTAGDRRLAAEVSKLRRPTPAAWAVNQLARRHPGEVEELVRLGEVLRAAQDGALAGDRAGDLRQAGRARRDAVAGLAERAEGFLADRGGGGPGAHAGEVAATLEAASLDAEAAEAVLAGRLSGSLQPPSGFAAFDSAAFDLKVTESRASKRATVPPSKPELDPGPERARREARHAVEEPKRRWEERSTQVRAAVATVSERRQAAQEAEGEVARVEDLLAETRRRLQEAVRAAEQAEDAASRAEDAASNASAAVRDADQRLSDLR